MTTSRSARTWHLPRRALRGLVALPLLDVEKIGYGSTLLNCALVAVLVLALGALALWADRRLSREHATMIA